MRLVKLLLLFNHNKLIYGIYDDILDATELSVNIINVLCLPCHHPELLNWWEYLAKILQHCHHLSQKLIILTIKHFTNTREGEFFRTPCRFYESKEGGYNTESKTVFIYLLENHSPWETAHQQIDNNWIIGSHWTGLAGCDVMYEITFKNCSDHAARWMNWWSLPGCCCSWPSVASKPSLGSRCNSRQTESR